LQPDNLLPRRQMCYLRRMRTRGWSPSLQRIHINFLVKLPFRPTNSYCLPSQFPKGVQPGSYERVYG
jgi:hypothetical protein